MTDIHQSQVSAGQPSAGTPKQAALAALAALSPFEPVASVEYRSAGRLLVVGEGAAVDQAIAVLGKKLSIAVFWTGVASPPNWPSAEVSRGEIVGVDGFLGAFELRWRTNAGAPEQLAQFDLLLDLSARPLFDIPQPPQGYFHASTGDERALQAALAVLPEMIGEFEKPKYFAYKESICAHSRSRQSGCNKCIEICSTKAISSAGDTVLVDPHLCMGCGACATVCPSGAMSFQYPRVADRGAQLRALLGAYGDARQSGDAAPVIVFHNGGDGASALAQTDVPANALPLEAWHVASLGLDVMLGAVAYGANGVIAVSQGSEAPHYAVALQREMQMGDIILNALGFGGTHFVLCTAAEVAAAAAVINAASGVSAPARFHLSNDKRSTLEFAIEHFAKYAMPAAVPEVIALPAGAMWGSITVDQDKCTMCLACAGSCPESALMDGGEDAVKPQLNFIERNCVQCGICASTCPERAITLTPRLLMTEQRKKAVLLNETEPFDCISCGKSLGTRKLIDAMLGKLAGHSMFQTEGSLKRLQMCADCRVVDMMSNKNEMSILTGRPIE